MPTCPRCQNTVEAIAIQCPHCRLTLKAHGHPGITLHQATDETYLCDTCVYHADNTCTFPQRPYARTCTLYQSIHTPPDPAPASPPPLSWRLIWQRHSTWIMLAGLIGLSLLIALA